MLFNILLFLLMVDGVVLTVAVLLQAGQGGGLASLGGDSYSMVGGHHASKLLVQTAWTSGALFMVLGLVLSTMSSSRFSSGTSEVQRSLLQNAPAAPAGGAVGDPVSNLLNTGSQGETPPSTSGEGATPPGGNQ